MIFYEQKTPALFFVRWVSLVRSEYDFIKILFLCAYFFN